MTISQGIKSYNGVAPPSLTKDGGTTILLDNLLKSNFQRILIFPYKEGGKYIC